MISRYQPPQYMSFPWPNPNNERIKALEAELATAKEDAWDEGYQQACADNGDEWGFETDGASNPYRKATK